MAIWILLIPVFIPTQITSKNEIELFPNPLSTEGTLKLNSSSNMVKIFSVDGRLIRDYGIINQNKLIISKGDLSPGLYLIQINDQVTGEIQDLKLFVD